MVKTAVVESTGMASGTIHRTPGKTGASNRFDEQASKSPFPTGSLFPPMRCGQSRTTESDPPSVKLSRSFRESSGVRRYGRPSMKRLLLISAACLAAILPLGELAIARDGDGGHRRAAASDRGEGRGQGRRVEERRGEERRVDERRTEDRRGQDWRIDGRDRGPPARYERREEPDRGRRYDDRPPAYAPSYMREPGPRRGGGYGGNYAPESSRPASVDDYQRYRLRPPPRGFGWVRMGNGFALVGPDGRVFDRVD